MILVKIVGVFDPVFAQALLDSRDKAQEYINQHHGGNIKTEMGQIMQAHLNCNLKKVNNILVKQLTRRTEMKFAGADETACICDDNVRACAWIHYAATNPPNPTVVGRPTSYHTEAHKVAVAQFSESPGGVVMMIEQTRHMALRMDASKMFPGSLSCAYLEGVAIRIGDDSFGELQIEVITHGFGEPTSHTFKSMGELHLWLCASARIS